MGSESAEESTHAVPVALGSSACGQSRSSPLVYTLGKKWSYAVIIHTASTVLCFFFKWIKCRFNVSWIYNEFKC